MVCLPDSSSLKSELNSLDSDFFDLHILREKAGEGWFSSANSKLPLIVELQQDNHLKLFSGKHILECTLRNSTLLYDVCILLFPGPNYHPSFSKGLYVSTVTDVVYGVNTATDFTQYKMFLLDRPLVPKYTRADLAEVKLSASSSGISSLNSSRCPSTLGTVSTQLTVSVNCPRSVRTHASTSSRQTSASSHAGRPYSTAEGVTASRASLRSSKSENNLHKRSSGKKGKIRQPSADSGVGTDTSCSRGASASSNKGGRVGCNIYQSDTPFILPARITAYAE